MHHLAILAVHLAIIIDGLDAHVPLVGVVVQRVAEFTFLGRKLLNDLVRRRGGSTGIDRTEALVGLVFGLGRQRQRRNGHKRQKNQQLRQTFTDGFVSHRVPPLYGHYAPRPLRLC